VWLAGHLWAAWQAVRVVRSFARLHWRRTEGVGRFGADPVKQKTAAHPLDLVMATVT